jgi:hypothetical protein
MGAGTIEIAVRVEAPLNRTARRAVPGNVQLMIAIILNLLACGPSLRGHLDGLAPANERLKVLREGQMGFAKAVADLDAAAARAERGLADLKAASDEMAEVLVSRIEHARVLRLQTRPAV